MALKIVFLTPPDQNPGPWGTPWDPLGPPWRSSGGTPGGTPGTPWKTPPDPHFWGFGRVSQGVPGGPGTTLLVQKHVRRRIGVLNIHWPGASFWRFGGFFLWPGASFCRSRTSRTPTPFFGRGSPGFRPLLDPPPNPHFGSSQGSFLGSPDPMLWLLFSVSQVGSVAHRALGASAASPSDVFLCFFFDFYASGSTF